MWVPDIIGMYPHRADRIYKHSPEHRQLRIKEGQIFKVEGATIRTVHGLDHSHGHICFVLEGKNAMFTGHNILEHGTTAVEQLSLYMETPRRLQSQGRKTGYPAHGVVIPDLNGKITTELTQNARRENQCLRGLVGIRKKGSTGPLVSVGVTELISIIHSPRVDEEVRKMVLEPSWNRCRGSWRKMVRLLFE